MNKKIKIAIASIASVLVVGGAYTGYKAIEPHKVTYDLAGGTMVTKDPVTEVRWIDEPSTPTAEKDHYKFEGWTDGTTTISSIKHARNDVSLTAVWKPETYSITYKDGDKEIEKGKYTYGSKAELATKISDDEMKNHPYEDFRAWTLDGKEVKTLSETDYGDKTVEAEFSGKTYKITYDLYDGTADGLPSTYKYGEGIGSFPDATLDGYVFDGWFTDEACTAQIKAIAADSHQDIHLYASYHKAPVESNYVASGGSYVASTSNSYSGTYNTSSSSSSNSSMNYNGACIPAIGYSVDNVVWDGTQADINAANTGVAMNWNLSWYEEGDDDDWENDVYHEHITTFYFDHAYQGLDSLPYRISAGAVFYLNGTPYYYSGNFNIYGNMFDIPDDVRKSYRLIIQTCVAGGGDYFLYFN